MRSPGADDLCAVSATGVLAQRGIHGCASYASRIWSRRGQQVSLLRPDGRGSFSLLSELRANRRDPNHDLVLLFSTMSLRLVDIVRARERARSNSSAPIAAQI